MTIFSNCVAAEKEFGRVFYTSLGVGDMAAKKWQSIQIMARK